MSKTKLNYWIDVAIGLFFIGSALSGLLLFFFPSGYQGGRNPYYGRTILLLTTHQWDALHTWSSIGMIAGVGAHLVLHECNQWRDDQPCPLPEQRGYLVTQGFAAPGWHENQGIAARQQRLDDREAKQLGDSETDDKKD